MKLNFTGNSRGMRFVLLILVGLMLWFAWSRAKAEPVFFAGVGQMLAASRPLSGGLRLGVETGPWQASLVTHGETVLGDPNGGHYRVDPNMGACGTWHVARRRLSIGWGACLWEHGDFSVGDRGPVVYEPQTDTLWLDDDGIQLTAAIVMRRTMGEHFYVEWFHASTGGSTHYNRGRNLFSGGARF